MRSLFKALVASVERQGVSCDVTLHSLLLGAADATTGLYARSFTDSTISMVIQTENVNVHKGSAGLYPRVDAVGFSETLIHAGDEVTDGNSNRWRVLSVSQFVIGDELQYYVSALNEAYPGAGEGGGGGGPYYWIVYVLGESGATTTPSGIQFVPAGQTLAVSVVVDDAYVWQGWYLDGEHLSDDESTTVPAQSLGVVHILVATTSGSHLPIEADNVGLMEDLLRASGLQVEDQKPYSEDHLKAEGMVEEDTYTLAETVDIDNSP